MHKFWRKYTFSVNRIRQARGFGVHSPFAFRLITKVIREKAPYYAYDDIEAIKVQYITKALSYKQRRLRKQIHVGRGRLLFRLTNFFQPDRILEVGTAWGLSSLYLRKASHAAHLTIVEPSDEVNRFVQKLFAQTNEKAEFVNQSIATYLPAYSLSHHTPLYIVINRLPEADYAQLPQLLSTAIDNRSTIILDGIRDSNTAITCWRTLLNDERVRVTFDLKNIGIICCNPKLNKQNYRIKL